MCISRSAHIEVAPVAGKKLVRKSIIRTIQSEALKNMCTTSRVHQPFDPSSLRPPTMSQLIRKSVSQSRKISCLDIGSSIVVIVTGVSVVAFAVAMMVANILAQGFTFQLAPVYAFLGASVFVGGIISILSIERIVVACRTRYQLWM